MSGHWTHGRVYYRCRLPAEYALTTELSHPKSVYLREELVLPEIDEWLAQLFDPRRLSKTCSLLASSETDVEANGAITRAMEEMAECDRKLAKYRKALEEGIDPELVGKWIREVRQQRADARRRTQTPARALVSPEDIQDLVEGLSDFVQELEDADPGLKAEIYASLGLRLEYHPKEAEVRVSVAPPWAHGCVGGGT